MQHYNPMNLRSFQGHAPRIGQRVLIDPSAVVLGQVILEDDVSIWPQVAIRGDMHRIRVGARTSVQDGCVLHITHAGPFNTGRMAAGHWLRRHDWPRRDIAWL
jgi:carbonic anhydrase/acetyltransferase-like protein (isoleucine patch superfamily)